MEELASAPIPSKSLLCDIALWLTPLHVHAYLTWGEEEGGGEMGTILKTCDTKITPDPPAAFAAPRPPQAGTSGDDKFAIPVRNMLSRTGGLKKLEAFSIECNRCSHG